MEVLAWLLVGLAGYLPGSVPAGLIAGRMKGIDLRKVGSGNIGATNALRNLGTGIGIAVLIFDALKGLLPCLFFPGLLIGLFPEGSAPAAEGCRTYESRPRLSSIGTSSPEPFESSPGEVELCDLPTSVATSPS